MILRVVTIIVLLIHSIQASSQITVLGTVADGSTKKGIAFTNIGIPGKNAGTISNEDVLFVYTFPER